MIPIYTPSGSYLRHIDSDALQAIGGRATVVRNRRGHAKRAILRGVDDEYIRQHRNNQGEHFQQDLGGMRVHALRGVIGS